jgi:acetoin utilization deacetylase AcuC-like enzyme
VAIFDFDVHHGNGTEDAFRSDPSVLFISSHQGGAYPGTGKLEYVGTGDGEGMTVNIPVAGDTGNEGYKMVWEEVVAPKIRAFEPDIILVSAGAAHCSGSFLPMSTCHRDVPVSDV